jgi:hypothetical protein
MFVKLMFLPYYLRDCVFTATLTADANVQILSEWTIISQHVLQHVLERIENRRFGTDITRPLSTSPQPPPKEGALRLTGAGVNLTVSKFYCNR